MIRHIGMKHILHISITILLFIFYSDKAHEINLLQSNTDSTEIANSSLTFYNWYLNCLNTNSIYNIVQQNYHWEDTIPVLDIDEYLKELQRIDVVSDNFQISSTTPIYHPLNS